jgi:hypothetical protein
MAEAYAVVRNHYINAELKRQLGSLLECAEPHSGLPLAVACAP